jgi:hypothetical protein
MAALACGGQLPLQLAPLRQGLPLTVRDLPALLAWFDAPALIIVVRVVGAALAAELPVQST